ncbi:MAG: radical SAM protein [Candidatus Hodarchaeales archaeon]|jgi:DNA repair photolyase
MPIQYEEVKTSGKILNVYENPDSWFWVSASLNPYRGCEHNCKYCDGKAEWYRIDNFASHIRVKTDSHRKFEKELLSLGYIPKERPSLDEFLPVSSSQDIFPKKRLTLFAIGGGVCDVYQQAEEKYRITHKLLHVAHKFMIPVSILTKSERVLHDLKIIYKINIQSYANVSISITHIDDEIRKIFEPRSSSIEHRFDALKLIRKNNIPGGIMLMPILPRIGDTEENLRGIVKKGKEIGVKFILPAGLTLKPGRNKKEMFATIRKKYPKFSPVYDDLYSNNNKYGIPRINSKYSLNGAKIAHEFCRKYGIPDRIPRYLPSDIIKLNYYVSTILFNLAYYYQHVSEQPWKKITDLSKAARNIEKLTRSIDSLPINDLKSLTFNGTILEIVEEILQTGKSVALSQFQKPEDIFEGNLSLDKISE